MRKTVSQACDACRRRKIKCNGLQPCPGCMSAGLSCTFKIPQKRGGNQGARATVLNELRGIQSQQAQPQNAESAPVSPNQQLARNGGGLETISIDACIDAYVERIYPVVPLLVPEMLRDEASHTSTSLLSRQFIVSFCAYVVTFGKVLDEALLSSSHTTDVELGKQLLEAALRIQNPDRVSEPSRQSIFISFFLYGAYAGLGNYRQGWFYLREATTLFTMQKGESEGWYGPNSYRCLFWILVISERYVRPAWSAITFSHAQGACNTTKPTNHTPSDAHQSGT